MSLQQKVRQGLVDLEILNCMIPSLTKPPKSIKLDNENLKFIRFLDSPCEELDLPLIIIKIKQYLNFPDDYLSLEKYSNMHNALAAYKKAVAPRVDLTFDQEAINSTIRAVRMLVKQCLDDYDKLSKKSLSINTEQELYSNYSTKPLLRIAKLDTIYLSVKDFNVTSDSNSISPSIKP